MTDLHESSFSNKLPSWREQAGDIGTSEVLLDFKDFTRVFLGSKMLIYVVCHIVHLRAHICKHTFDWLCETHFISLNPPMCITNYNEKYGNIRKYIHKYIHKHAYSKDAECQIKVSTLTLHLKLRTCSSLPDPLNDYFA